MTFNAKKHLIKMSGKEYLEAKWRIAWFREDHPKGRIHTEIVSMGPVVVRAVVYTEAGEILASAHGGATDKGNAVWSGHNIEKAETAAIGRALGHAGYGTQFATSAADVQNADSLNHPVDNPVQTQPQPQLQPQRRMPIDDDLTDRSIAQAFIEHWRAQSLADSEVLEALGVAKLSLWTQGRKAADAAVNNYIGAKLARTGAGSTALDEGKKAFDDAIYKATQVHFNDPTHFKHFMDKYRKSGEITDAMSSQHIIEFINWNREQEGKSFVSWWQDAIEMKALKSDLSNRFGVKSVEAALELLGLELKDFRSRMDLLNAVKQYKVEEGSEAIEALAT